MDIIELVTNDLQETWTVFTARNLQQSVQGVPENHGEVRPMDKLFCSVLIAYSVTRKAELQSKRSGTWSTTKFKSDGWVTVVEAAEAKKDEKLLTRIRNVDLFSAEAQFHPSCRKTYTSDSERGRGDDEEARLYQQHLEKAHKYAFDMVCDVVEKDILSGGKGYGVQEYQGENSGQRYLFHTSELHLQSRWCFSAI